MMANVLFLFNELNLVYQKSKKTMLQRVLEFHPDRNEDDIRWVLCSPSTSWPCCAEVGGSDLDLAFSCRERFAQSMAVACVVTLLLGVGDRHTENIMMLRDGTVFNIDYGWVLGQVGGAGAAGVTVHHSCWTVLAVFTIHSLAIRFHVHFTDVLLCSSAPKCRKCALPRTWLTPWADPTRDTTSECANTPWRSSSACDIISTCFHSCCCL